MPRGVRLTLTINVFYSAKESQRLALRNQLRYAAKHLHDEGLLTGPVDATVERYSCGVGAFKLIQQRR